MGNAGLITKEGVNFNVKIDAQSAVILGLVILGAGTIAVMLGYALGRLITKNV